MSFSLFVTVALRGPVSLIVLVQVKVVVTVAAAPLMKVAAMAPPLQVGPISR